MEGKDYFHVCTKGSDLPWMFRDDADFIAGVNRVGICVLTTRTEVFAFTLMDTHVHFVLYGSMPDCKNFIKRYKQLTGRWIYEKYGISGHLTDVNTSIIHIVSKEHLMEEVAYLDRNSIAAGYRNLPTEYPWGSAKYMFKEEHASDNRKYRRVCEISNSDLRDILASRVIPPSDWEIDTNGMINPRCFINVNLLESLFRTPNRYIYFLSKKVEGDVEMRHNQGVKSFIPDRELRLVIDDILRRVYCVDKVALLDFKSKISLAKTLRYEYASTLKQIARLLHMDFDLLKGFV